MNISTGTQGRAKFPRDGFWENVYLSVSVSLSLSPLSLSTADAIR